MVENPLILGAWLILGKLFCVKDFQKTSLTLAKSTGEKTHSLIMSHPGENALFGVLNEKMILFRHL